jgi:mannose-1-phosphate guanylyltransferase
MGTRLRPLTTVRAKPAVPVAGEALVRQVIRRLAVEGITEVVLNLHHLPHTIAAEVGDGSDLGVVARYSWEQPVVLGSAGGARLAAQLIEAGRFLSVNGDTLTTVSIERLQAAHESLGTMVTLALTSHPDPLRYGGVWLDDHSRVTGFVKRGAGAVGSYHFLGVQIVEAEALAAVPLGQAVSSIGGLYDDLIKTKPGSIGAFLCDAEFWDIGTVTDYWNTSIALGVHDGPSAGRHARIDPTARVTRTIVWDDVDIGANCVLDECIVTDGVRVAPDAHFRRTILLNGRDGVVATPFEVSA